MVEVGGDAGDGARAQGLVHHPQRLRPRAHPGEAQPVGIEPQGLQPRRIGEPGLARGLSRLDHQPPRPGMGVERAGEQHQREGEGPLARHLVRPGREAMRQGGVEHERPEGEDGRRRRKPLLPLW